MNLLVIFVGLLCLASVHAGKMEAEAATGAEAVGAKAGDVTGAEAVGADDGEVIPESEADPDEETTEPSEEDDFERMAQETDAEQPTLPVAADLDGKKLTISADHLSCANAYWNWNYYRPPQTIYGCCPRRWNYRCASSRHPLPCFYDRSRYNRLSWCCPIAPKIYESTCLCRSCAVLSPDCVLKGFCAPRRTRRWFLAICYANNAWAEIRSFCKSVTSSCYCRTRKPFSPYVPKHKLLPIAEKSPVTAA